ncbi:MAG: 2-C-methyl-D-erythritol 2,4-cyclodiphosphate synthase [Syntrophomonadaceae bacterium]|jgi:2-C-methyl-D-erythritol 2,4-cyclodiphosphate synthase|nr:2-C-methyl-D-erythritol 2,4-cyclodiphosphate synthase [Syntrophomonadaceae bacterium]MDH7497323.1 2-C-methyl-D-erythritol 2,4-cyclodiphosphate synthase [Syntrophomonadaceae bacterium]
MRVGIGYDAHRLVAGRALILGGVEIPWEKGLLGHSDADVLVHAVCDALLGAAGLGDIGSHFPDSDERYRGIRSVRLLEQVASMVRGHGFRVENVDVTVVAQKPRLAPYVPQMKRCLSRALGVDEMRVNIKATTTEGLGFEGREEGMSAQAVACIAPADQP